MTKICNTMSLTNMTKAKFTSLFEYSGWAALSRTVIKELVSRKFKNLFTNQRNTNFRCLPRFEILIITNESVRVMYTKLKVMR